MNLDLKKIANSLVTNKWMLSAEAHNLLMTEVNKLMDNNNHYELPEQKEFNFDVKLDFEIRDDIFFRQQFHNI